MRTLCLFTNEFPYGSWEPYLETEVQYYEGFDKVMVFSLQLRKEHASSARKLPSNFEVIPIYYAPRYVYLLNSFRVLFDNNLYAEIGRLKRSGRLGLHQIIDLFVFLSRSDYEARKILQKVHIDKDKKYLFYSYRFEYQPYVADIIKRRKKLDCPIISRAHRYDLYEDRRKDKYIPMREYLLSAINYVFPCSLDGKNYLSSLYPKYSEKIETRFLGTLDYGAKQIRRNDRFRIVSCSNVVKVKRLDCLVEALKKITEYKIVWTHFGDGPELENIRKMSRSLPDNISVDFRGNVANKDLMEIYQNENFNLFVNVSESEGIPVSIMEAMSFGIPCLATNAGGTGEIIENNVSGVIIPVSSSPEQIENQIKRFIQMDDGTYYGLCNKARKKWLDKFNATENYKEFNTELLKLVDDQ